MRSVNWWSSLIEASKLGLVVGGADAVVEVEQVGVDVSQNAPPKPGRWNAALNGSEAPWNSL
jgi:hypothetical protein